MKTTLIGLSGAAFLSIAVAGCKSAPAAPFDQMETANVLAFRLQNYEPPPEAAPAAAPQAGAIPGLPAEITQWAQAALPGLQQLLPPGLLPPGMIPGAAPAAVPPPAPNAPRFPMGQPNFRILGQTQIMDSELKEELAKLFGDEDSFQAQHANCMYAEMGLSFGSTPNDVLISFSCNQVEARGFAWPHPYRGMTPKTVERLAHVVQKVWPS